MNVDDQILIAMVIALVVGVPLGVSMAKKYTKEGKSIKIIPLKIGFCVGLPIVSVPVLLEPGATFKDYFVIVIMAVYLVLYWRSIFAIRKSLGKDD